MNDDEREEVTQIYEIVRALALMVTNIGRRGNMDMACRTCTDYAGGLLKRAEDELWIALANDTTSVDTEEYQ